MCSIQIPCSMGCVFSSTKYGSDVTWQMFSPGCFPDKWPGFPAGDTVHIRLRVSSKVVPSPRSHASCGRLTVHVTLCQISGPYAVSLWNSSYISIVSQMLPIDVGNTQFPLLPGCNISYRLQANIWRLCVELATSTSLCLDLHAGF